MYMVGNRNWGPGAASYRGHAEIVKLLLDKGADVNEHWGGQYDHALQAASCEGYTETVKLLVDKGADINAQGGEFGSALCQCCSIQVPHSGFSTSLG
jgi:ankyrin repeat protein